MNIETIVSQLKQERNKLDNAIRALEGGSNHGRPPATRTLSVSARNKIAAAQKARWARVRRTNLSASVANSYSGANTDRQSRKLSRAARERIAQAQKKR